EKTLIDEGASTEESSSNNDLHNYQLTRDRALEGETCSYEKNQIWSLVPKPRNQKLIQS
ncbi:unnamed protein product, partial [Citrullus colocynthis]